MASSWPAGPRQSGGTAEWEPEVRSHRRRPSARRASMLVGTLALVGTLVLLGGGALMLSDAARRTPATAPDPLGVALRPDPTRTPNRSGPASPTRSASPSSPAPPERARMVFPVVGSAVSYASTHHDYPATDIMTECGAAVVAVTDGVVLVTVTVDRYDPRVNDGATRGGLAVAILGDDGVRYYGSHLARIEPGIEPQTRVAAGQLLGRVGRSGNASACHLHFGISPPCAGAGDWWIQRGVIWPGPYLDSWRTGGERSPVEEVARWQAENGCPSAPPPGA